MSETRFSLDLQVPVWIPSHHPVHIFRCEAGMMAFGGFEGPAVSFGMLDGLLVLFGFERVSLPCVMEVDCEVVGVDCEAADEDETVLPFLLPSFLMSLA